MENDVTPLLPPDQCACLVTFSLYKALEMLIQFSPLHKHQLFGQFIQIPFEKKKQKTDDLHHPELEILE